jgi:hypothetical protein
MRDRRQVTARDGELAVLECNVCECTESTERPAYHGVGKVPWPRGPEHGDACRALGRGGNQTVARSIVLPCDDDTHKRPVVCTARARKRWPSRAGEYVRDGQM